jgi:hypothetical protein
MTSRESVVMALRVGSQRNKHYLFQRKLVLLDLDVTVDFISSYELPPTTNAFRPLTAIVPTP